jgi:FxsC-like protein
MPYEFFFSYTRGNNDEYLKIFFQDLSDEVRGLRGLGVQTDVGFFDQQDIELGETWDKTISNALRESKVMVSVYSPGYFLSDYCGKEWEIFNRRCQAYGDNAQPKPQPPAPCIKPVLWIPFKVENVSQRVRAIQFSRGDPQSISNIEGLRYVRKQIGDYRSEYNAFVHNLAKEIVDTADSYSLPDLDPMPSLGQVPSAWLADVNPAAQPAGPPARMLVTSPKHVRFVFVAADPNQFGNVRPPDPYLDNGGGDWKPFYPDMSAIGPFVQHIVSDQELGFTSDELTFSAGLIQEIETAWKERKIVVILVDGWSVNWQQGFQDVLRDFDQRNFLNCSVLIPWNENDPVINSQADSISSTLQQTFFFKSSGNSIFYRDKIRNADELRDALRDVLTRIKAEVRKRAEVSRPLPPEISKPIISGPSTVNRAGI